MRPSRTVPIVSQSKASLRAGLMLCHSRPDKGYSLVDCISMLTMRHEGLTEVLTNDRYFEQEGFRGAVSGSLDQSPQPRRQPAPNPSYVR